MERNDVTAAVDDTETTPNSDDLQRQLATIEAENKSLRDEFNAQRAKLKELFMQKEGELARLLKAYDEVKKELIETKSQVVVAEYKRETEFQHQGRRAQEEIASLQQLVHETIEVSSSSKAQIDRLLEENERLRREIMDLRELQHQQDGPSTPSLAPVLNHVKKTLARKLGADSHVNDSLEDSMRKAQEDAEVLRSLVVPLEEEIKALKEKLRSTDDELQQCRANAISSVPPHPHCSASASVTIATTASALSNATTNDATVSENDGKTIRTNPTTPITESCVMCKNYESQLVASQNEIETIRKDVDELTEDLKKESEVRRDLEKEWQEKSDAYNDEVDKLKEQVDSTDKEMLALRKHYSAIKEEINQELIRLMADREEVYRHLNTVQEDNDFLAGRHLATSEEFQNQRIDMPNNVEDLQILLLKCHEDMIQARVGCEFEQRKSTSFKDEAQVLRDQLTSVCDERQGFEREITIRIRELEDHIRTQETQRDKLLSLKETFEQKEMEFNKQSSELRVQVIELQESNEKLERHNFELKSKITVLQQELGNSEAVQKDFVRLSQSLQMELEKIRAADTAVRWQHDDDVDNCPSCKNAFSVTRRKINCRHCGTIYCDKCLTKAVQTGRNNKPARVCDVCHTLLVQNTAPYFSQAPPHSPM